jgi:5-methylcytosine-specific restriction protein A
MDNKNVNELDLLKPSEANRIMDLVEQAGIDVSDWADFKGNAPASNPKYCYEWSFVDEAQGVMACCLWHDMLDINEGKVKAVFNVLKTSETRTSSQKNRAKKLHQHLHQAKDNDWTIRAIVVSEKSRTDGTAKVDKRLLDESPWYVEDYDPYTNQWTLARGIGKHKTQYVDQFYAIDKVTKKERTSSVFVRDPKQRTQVLERAKGNCELCGALGFQMPTGALYLETHHIVPLSENGPDIKDNMIALCPNDHREAHYGLRAQKLRREMLSIVSLK